jgi:hypothetical protein
MKKIICYLFLVAAVSAKTQVIYSESFGGLSLNSSSYTLQTSQGINTVVTTYTTVPTGFDLINDGLKNNVGSVLSPNKPFNISSLKTTGWAVAYNEVEKDTFLVSTSWLDTAAAVFRYAVSPVINSITFNSILSWNAKSPDPNFPEGYQVFVTTNTSGTLTANDFTTAALFSLPDGATSGGGEKNVWTKRGVSLAAYAGQNIRVAFKNISKGMYQLWIDDVTVENVTSLTDAEMGTGKPIYKYNLINTPGTISCRITNRGSVNISSVTVNYSIGGGTPQSESFAPNLNPYGFSDITFATPYSISTPGYYKVKVWVSNTNGVADPNKTNDTLYTSLSIMNSAPVKNVLAEQFVSAFDGDSPDAQEKLSALAQASINVIQVNIHGEDSLKVNSVSSLLTDYRKSNSSLMIDRNYFYDLNTVAVDRPYYSSRISQRNSAVVPVSVSITDKSYNSGTRVLDFTVQATFTAEVQGDYRINAYLTENYVHGPSSDMGYNGWNQLNDFYSTPWSPYYQMGSFLPAANGYVLNAYQYKHHYVLDAALDGAYGAAGIIPMTGGTSGQTYTKAYSYTVPLAMNGESRYNIDNMRIVAFVAEYNTNLNERTVLNCTADKVNTNAELVSVEELLKANEFTFYPNPSSGSLNIFLPENIYQKKPVIKVYDVLGKEVYTSEASLNYGVVHVDLGHLESGTYFLSVESGNSRTTKKLLINR